MCNQITITFLRRYRCIFKTWHSGCKLRLLRTLLKFGCSCTATLIRQIAAKPVKPAQDLGSQKYFAWIAWISSYSFGLVTGSLCIERSGIPWVALVALHDLATAKFLQAALFDCLMPRLNFGVSAEVRLALVMSINTEQLDYMTIQCFLYMCNYATSSQSVFLSSLSPLLILLLGPGPSTQNCG